MTTLILLLPQRSRLRSQGRESAGTEAPPRGESGRDYAYVLTPDGQQISAQGRSPAALLPKADSVALMPAEDDLSWHRVLLPHAGRQMQEALAGLMEEQLLEDPQTLAFALAPDAKPGTQAWVAVSHKSSLLEPLSQLEQAHVFVDRIVPQSWPEATARGHFVAKGEAALPGLHWSHAQGVASLSLDGNLARQLLASDAGATWTGEPAVIEAAERWLGAAVAPQTAAERALAALRSSPWNLRQFELAPRTRGVRSLRQLWRGLLSPAWRPVRWALAGLLLVHLLGLNLWAWQQRQTLESRRLALTQTLSSTFPHVRAILDAPLQMRRETELLRASAGRAGDQDLEVLLSAAATAWPADRGPVDALSFETGRLLIPAAGWSPEQVEQFRRQLASEGWQLDVSEGRLSLSRGRTP